MKKNTTKLYGAKNFIARIKFRVIAAGNVYGIGSSLALTIFLSPFFIVLFSCTFLLLSSTRPLFISMIIENPLAVGLLTSVFLIAGGGLGLRLVLHIKKHKKGLLMFWFFLALSVGLLLIGIEKVRWGQLFFISNDPSSLNNINQQSETVVHNFQFWRDHLEIFPLTFGLVGLLGVWASNLQRFSKISSPYVLLSWFAVIAFISAIDLTHDFYKPIVEFDDFVDNLEDVIELMVGISGFLFVWLNARKIRLKE